MANVDVSSIAQNAMTGEEAEEQDHLWKFLIYGNPGTGKTHFAYTMPEPVCMIDTEGKADAITGKFSDDKEIYLWQPQNYDELVTSLDEALDVLDAFKSQEGIVGSVVVDSISLAWDWAQQKHMEMAYPGRSENEVDFRSALQADGSGDWQTIKRFHNERFRDRMVEAPYNVCWTATSQEDYGAILSGDHDDPPAKPQGEKNNPFKATEVLHVYEGQEAVPTANLKKTALTKWRFAEMEWPSFEKVTETIEEIAESEASDKQITLSDLKSRFPDEDVDLYEGDPDLAMRGGDDE